MNKMLIDHYISQFTPAKIIEILTPYLTKSRIRRINEVLGKRIPSVTVATECPSDPRNAAAIVRTGESLGITSVHTITSKINSLNAKLTTQGAFYWINTYHHQNLDAFLACMRQQEFVIAGAVTDAELTPEEIPVDKPICLFFGNERLGLSSQARSVCDIFFTIPMFGMSESLNLSVSAAISLYEVLKRKREPIGNIENIQKQSFDLERARYYARSVEPRLLKGLLNL